MRPIHPAAAVIFLLAASVAVAAQDRVARVDRLPTMGKNAHYIANREPLAPAPLIKLPVGAVRPRGWLRRQLELQAAGFHGNLGEISSFLRKENNAWLSPTGQGDHGWEEVPYWLKGYGDCAYLLDNHEQIQEAKVWIEAAIQSQRQDGYFGPRGVKSTVESTSGRYDLWPNMVMLHCLQSYHEATGDRRVIDLMTRYFHWQRTVPETDFLPPYWQQQRGADNLWSVLWLYNRTGDAALLELADKIHRHAANWTDGVPSALHLVGPQGDERVGRARVRRPPPRAESRGLLVRRCAAQRRLPRSGLMAAALPEERPVARGRQRRRLRHGNRSLQHRRL